MSGVSLEHNQYMESANPHELNGKQNFHFISGFWDLLDDVGASQFLSTIMYSPVVSMPSLFAYNIPTGSSISLSLPTHYQQDNTSTMQRLLWSSPM